MDPKTYQPDDPYYQQVKDGEARNLEAEATMNDRAAAELQQRISSWVHVAIAGIRNA
jgi:hypothetical protein